MTSPGAVLSIILITYLLIVLDLCIAYTGMPEIAADLGMGPVELSWVQNAYLLCFGGFLLLSARAGDLFWFKRTLLSGIFLFAVSSLVIGFAGSPVELIAARAVQGVGASIIAPSVFFLIAVNFPEGEPRNKALAWYSMVAGVGSSLDMVLGGFFAGALSWRVGFLVNVPIGAALWLAGWIVLDNTRHGVGRLDVAGAIISTVGMASFVWGIVRTADHGWSDPSALLALVVAVAMLSLFVRLQARTSDPLLPLDIFNSRVRVGAYLARMCFLGGAVGFFFFETQFLQRVLGFSPVEADFCFLPMTVLTFATAVFVPRLTLLFGNAMLLCLSMAANLFWLSLAGPDAVVWRDIALPMVLVGIGNGGGLGPLTVVGVAGVSGRNQGAASGAVNVAHQLGGSLDLSILVTIFASEAGAPLWQQLSATIFATGILLALGLIFAAVLILPAARRP
ncbi:MFS transporter [Breoghania sp.]|uniref:MFS transporter n=1 Tax=Breoghania sp. TaxID=2065378 RepID=UPI0026118265|nr:MFS transporter [Breoghania sp.]MDJ0930569.1 MFS transporter [Breoghania sp.]